MYYNRLTKILNYEIGGAMIVYAVFKALRAGDDVLVTSWGDCTLAYGKVTRIIDPVRGIIEVEITSLDLTEIAVESVIGAKEAFGNKNWKVGEKRKFRADLEVFQIVSTKK